MKATQEQQFRKWFERGVYTMKQVSVKTDIDRSHVCYFIGKLKKTNSTITGAWSGGKSLTN